MFIDNFLFGTQDSGIKCPNKDFRNFNWDRGDSSL